MPKQYLQLHDRTVLEWSVAPFLAHAACFGAVVVIAAGDARWPDCALSRHPLVRAVNGGQDRASSVLAGLISLREACHDDDWVLVHDAARPCLAADDLQQLLDTVQADEVGGLLAAPMVDTLKRADADHRVTATVARAGLWRALTPQMFRYGVLLRALQEALDQGLAVTDESQAVELLGLSPRLVAGSSENLKITVPDDIARAGRLLAHRRQPEDAT